MENEELSPASGGGAGLETELKDAGSQSQDSSQGQSPEPTQVESGESQASSKGTQTRNSNWANQRLIDKAVQRAISSALDAKLAPLMEKFQPAQPSAPPATNDIDYSDLSGSIKKIIEATLNQRLEESLGKTLPKIKEELTGSIRSTSKLQEARNYLISQNDIGQDQAKHDEIQEIIANDPLLYASVEKMPYEVIKRAVDQWRKSKINPNTPGKGELSTVAGGMASGQRRTGEPSIQKLKDLQAKAGSVLSNEERDKLNEEIKQIVAFAK